MKTDFARGELFTKAHHASKLASDCELHFMELTWALQWLNGTLKDACAPKGYVFPADLALDWFASVAGIKTLQQKRTAALLDSIADRFGRLDALPPAPWLRGA